MKIEVVLLFDLKKWYLTPKIGHTVSSEYKSMNQSNNGHVLYPKWWYHTGITFLFLTIAVNNLKDRPAKEVAATN